MDPARGVLGEARAHAAFRSAPRSGMGQSLLLKQLHFLRRRQEKGPLPAQFPHLPSGRSCGHPDRPLYRERVLLYCIRKEASRGASVHVAVWTRGQERNPLRAWHSTAVHGWQFSGLRHLSLPGPSALWLVRTCYARVWVSSQPGGADLGWQPYPASARVSGSWAPRLFGSLKTLA